MKKLFLALATVATLLAVSCNKGNTPVNVTDADIQGTWTVTSGQVTFTKNGAKVSFATYAQDMGIDISEMSEVELAMAQQIFDEVFSANAYDINSTITFKNGVVTIADDEDAEAGTYTLNGGKLTITADGQSVPFTITAFSGNSMTLFVDGFEMTAGLAPGISQLKEKGYVFTTTVYLKKK